MKPIVAIGIDKDGEYSVAFSGEVDVYWIDERTPSDRVFKSSNQVERKVIQAALGESVIGFIGDGSQGEVRLIDAGIQKPTEKLN